MLIEINLLPAELRSRPRSERRKLNIQVPRFVPYVLGGVIVLVAALSFAVMMYTGSIRSKLAHAKGLLKKEKIRAAQTITLSTQLPELEKRAVSIVERVSAKTCWWEILDQVSRCCPSNVVLESIKIEKQSSDERPATLLISGYYERSTGLEITFTRNLQSSAKLAVYVDEVYPGQTSLMGEKTLFTVKCRFKQTEKEEETGEEE